MIAVDKVTIRFGGIELFRDISFLINPRDKIGLTGKNGAGKSTLLKLFMGIQQPDEGNVVVPDNMTLGYLPQQMKHVDSKNVFDEVKTAFDEILSLKEEIDRINHSLAERTDYESKEYMQLIEQLTDLNDRFDMLGGTDIEGKIEKTLFGLGFLSTDFKRLTKTFSGGWRMRIELAKILLKNPSLLLLDEPTNHLDIESIQWLESFLKDYPGAIIIISHDRAFLNNMTNRTIEISLGRIYDYPVPYTKFVAHLEQMREQQKAAFDNQQKMIQDTEAFIERFRYKATKAVQVQSRIKQLEKMKRIEIDETDSSSLNIKFPPAPRSGSIVVETENLGKSYGNLQVLNNLDILIERGEKVAFVGKNGEGKTTLSRIIIGELEYEGKLKIGHNVKTGYFAQNQDEIINEKLTVFQTIDNIATGDIRTKIRDILGAFLFSGEDIDKKVKVLSGGEKSRLAMAKLLLEPYNLLVLDEPTNHLDMVSKDLLKNALLKYNGTLIVVSHDREFLDGLTDKIYEFKNKNIYENLSGIYEFLRKKKLNSLQELEKNIPTGTSGQKNTFDSKAEYQRKKEIEKNIRKVSNQVNKAEKKIEELENEIDTLEKQLANPENTNDTIYTQYKELKKELENEMQNWTACTEQLENLKNNRE
jgi:ATP-binding cassette, subfamily F, member 3